MVESSDNPPQPDPRRKRWEPSEHPASDETSRGGGYEAGADAGESFMADEGYELADVPSGPRPTEPPSPSADSPAPLPVSQPVPVQPSPQPNSTALPRKRQRAEKQVLSNPPQQRARLTAWLVLLACLILAAVPMAVDLGRPAVIHEHEARALATSAETWRQQTEWTYVDQFFEALVPSYNDQSQLASTPGTTWLHLIAFRAFGGEPQIVGTAQLALAGRLVSVICGLVTVASVFWIGLTIGSLRTATLAGLICAAHPLLLYHSRLAGAEMPEIALMALTIAAAVWAIGPLKMRGSLWRQGFGWLLCGLALGMALLTGGPTLLPLIVIPLLLFFVMYPHRLSHLMGLVAAAIIAILATTPWTLYVHEQRPEAWQSWTAELIPAYFEEPALLGEVAGQRLLLLVIVTLPWTAWLIAGLLQPFSTSSAGSRLRMMLGWMWFVPVALLLLGAPGEPTILEMLVVIPAAALLTGQVVRQFSDLSDEGRHTRMWRLLRWPHAFILMFASVALPAVGHFQDGMVRAGWLTGEVALTMPAWYWLGLGTALMLLVILSMRFAERHHPGRAISCWAIWIIVATACIASPVARGPLTETPVQHVGEELRQVTTGSPLYWLGSADALDARLVLYARRELRPVTVDELAPIGRESQRESERVYVLATADRTLPEVFEPVRTFAAEDLTLWQAGDAAARQQGQGQQEQQNREHREGAVDAKEGGEKEAVAGVSDEAETEEQ